MWRCRRRCHMRKKSIKAAKKRTPPAMATPSPTLRPVLEELDDDWVAPLSEFDEDVGEEVGPVLVGPLDAAAVGLVLLVDDDEEEEVEVVDVVVVDVVAVDATYSTPVGTEAEKSADVVGV
jgi:hypothetical protein